MGAGKKPKGWVVDRSGKVVYLIDDGKNKNLLDFGLPPPNKKELITW